MRRMFAALLWLACGCALAQAPAPGGVVYEDANGNGQRDAGEPGIAGVAVSNGRAVTRTDANGRYELPMAAGQTIFVVKPAGWRVPAGAGGLPDFWRQQPLAHASGLRFGGLPAGTLQPRVDFPLRRVGALDGNLEVLVFADPQPRSRTDVGYYRRDIVEPLAGNTGAALGLTLGDIVDDDLSLYPDITAATASLRVPWLHVAGNHDMDLDAKGDADALQTFRRHFGPDTFAWEEARATFVLLDDVIHQPGAKPAYVGGLRDDQFA